MAKHWLFLLIHPTPKQIEDAATRIENTFGPIDVWVNDAMLSVFSPFKEMTPEEFKRVTEVSYLGFVYGTMTALHRMLPNRPNNLWQPVDEQQDHGMHGSFDAQARASSLQLWTDTHPGILALVGAGIAASIATVL